MTSMFRIDATGDLVREDGSFQRVEGPTATAQWVTVRFRLYKREVPWNTSLGIMYPGQIFGESLPDEFIENTFADVAEGTPGIASVDTIQLTRGDDRRASISWSGTYSEADDRRRGPLHDTFAIDLNGG